MKKYVKAILYYSSLICPLVDIFKGIINGITDTLTNAENNYKKLKKIDKETIINHKSVLKEKNNETKI